MPVANDPDDLPKGWLGAVTSSSGGNLKVTSVPSDTPAAAAGLSVDDEIIAIDRHRVDASGLKRLVGLMGAGTVVDLLVSRQGLITTLQVTLGEEPTETWKLKIKKDSTEEQKARINKWLGFEPEEEESEKEED